MKSIINILFFLFISQLCLATEQKQLPEEPWAQIAEMNLTTPSAYWESDVKVKLVGSYTKNDSLIIASAIAQLDSITQTISVSFSGNELANYAIFFFDSINRHEKQYEFSNRREPSGNGSNYTSSMWSVGNGINYMRLYIDQEDRDSGNYENRLKNRFFSSFISGYLNSDKKIALNRNSIFNAVQGDPHYNKLNALDIAIIKETYKEGYKDKLKLAKKQFKPGIITQVKLNPYIYLLLPLWIILFLLLFVFKGIRKVTNLIQNKFLKFNAIAIIISLFVAPLLSFYLSLSYGLFYHFDSFDHFLLNNFTFGTVIIFMVGIIAVNILKFIEEIIHRNVHKKLMKVVLIFFSIGLVPFLATYGTLLLLTQGRLSMGEYKILSIVLFVCLLIAAFRSLISYFIFKEKDLILESERKFSRLRELKTKAELNALHSKINPHFLYNSLNSIAGLAKTDAEKTEHMALSLSKLFRYSINKEQTDWSTFADEMEIVRIYLDIEKVRFDDRLEFTIDLPVELKTIKVPRFIIQPLVENAIKHGISKMVSKGEITASVHRKDKWIEIVVADNGPDFPDELIPGFGLQSIYDKLEIMYPNRFELHFLNAPNKHILIKIALK